ncbi:succinate dehydrogenase [Sorangium cellulosum]|uniref:Succinate dehydrogenase n=1 Tax=Sorangium cellulosum TaxID=56 RepID=A0A4P2QCL1_SORCE|nr:succinate dehydrogenase cytochrome b558 subunit [Sorangium cellulosum]AUX27078.1 succinate dehydrogenase [Sorangium cellulosum]
MSEATPARSLSHESRRSFLLRKLHSLTGAIPVGGFLVFHFWTNAKALQGQERFDDAVAEIARMPYLPALEIGLVVLPLAFHALYGVKLALEGKPNVGKYTYSRNWMYTMQRVTGVLAFAFIGFHMWEYWAQKWLGRMAPEEFYPRLCANMASTVGGVPVIALVYLFGIAASVFHFANGLWGFCFSWGITVSRRAQRMAAVAFGVVGLLVFLLGANTVIYFATGAALPGTASAAADGARTCADLPLPATARRAAGAPEEPIAPAPH